jgi:hypothetical protein
MSTHDAGQGGSAQGGGGDTRCQFTQEEPALDGVGVEDEVRGPRQVGPRSTEQVHTKQALSVELRTKQALEAPSRTAPRKPSFVELCAKQIRAEQPLFVEPTYRTVASFVALPLQRWPDGNGSKVQGMDLGLTGCFLFFKNQFLLSVQLINRYYK